MFLSINIALASMNMAYTADNGIFVGKIHNNQNKQYQNKHKKSIQLTLKGSTNTNG